MRRSFHFKTVFLALLGVGGLVSAAARAQNNPVPFINNPLVPTAVAPGGPGFTLTVNGTGFVSGATVNWNGTPLATTFVSQGQLKATVPAANVATIGSASITVVNPAPGGGVSNAGLFLITSPISSVSFQETDIGSNVNAIAITTADFDGDGKADIAVLQDGAVLIFLGNSDGTFQAPRSFPIDAYAGGGGRMVLGDFNGDGKIDVAIANHKSNADPSQGSVSVLLGNGDGTFQPAVNTPVPGMLPQEMVSADFNRDGTLDLAIGATPSSGAEVQIFLGRRDGSFTTGPNYSTSLANVSLLGLAVGDFDRDGQPDLPLSLCYGGSSPSGASYCIYHLWQLLGNGDGSFRWGTNLRTGAGGYGITAADLNGDANLDLAGGYPIDIQYFRAGVYVGLGNGDGTFQAPLGFQVGSGSVGGQPVAADMNGDGKPDLVTPGHYQFFVLMGNGAGSFQTPGTSSPARYYPLSVPAVADFNGDGRPDLAMGSSGASALLVFIQPSLVDLQPGGFHFGDQLIGTQENTGTATLTNNAGGPLAISSISVTGANAADFAETNDCPISPSTLAAGGTCTITVTFAHTTLGAKTAAVTISDNAPGDPQQTLRLTGTVVNPTATPTPTSLTFAGQPLNVPSASQTVTITNSGEGELTISGIMVSGDFAQTSTCGTTVPQAGQCKVSVTFNPSDAGTLFGILTITDNAADSPQTISLTGTGIPPSVTLSATILTFGNQLVNTTSAAQTVTLSNNGPGPLIVSSVGNSNYFPATSNCIGTVAASADCTVSIAFSPGSNGPLSGTVTIEDNAAVSPQTINVSGTGLGPVASLSPSSLSFPNQLLGTTSAAQTVTLTNTGGALMTLSSIAASSPFAETTDCVATLAPGASCHIRVTFTPTSLGIGGGSLNVTSDAPPGPSVSLAGTGAQFSLSLSPATASIAAGGAATFAISVAAASGFTQQIVLACTGAPPLAECVVSPSSITPTGASPTAATLTLTTKAATEVAPRGLPRFPPFGGRPWPAFLTILVAVLVCGLGTLWRGAMGKSPLRLRAGCPLRLGTRMTLAGVILGCVLAASCGGGAAINAVQHEPGTPPGNYTLTLTATSGSLADSAVVTVTVK